MVLLTSCSKDDDETSIDIASVYGTWECTSSKDYSSRGNYNDIEKGVIITINENGTFNSDGSTIGNGNWTINGNKFNAINNFGDSFNASLSVSSNKMTWKGSSSNGWNFTYVWTKKY